nr:hypothetical protein Iba_chr02dCG7130 [Ipomoea batatas]GMC66878.1 hypothetical protein Iba_chr02eCG9740 [Ipomoea batatas]
MALCKPKPQEVKRYISFKNQDYPKLCVFSAAGPNITLYIFVTSEVRIEPFFYSSAAFNFGLPFSCRAHIYGILNVCCTKRSTNGSHAPIDE